MCWACPAALRVTRTTLPSCSPPRTQAVIERADVGHDGTDGLGALHDAVHRRALYGDVVGQAVQPDRTVVGGRNADAVEADDICRRAFLGVRAALDGHERFLSGNPSRTPRTVVVPSNG